MKNIVVFILLLSTASITFGQFPWPSPPVRTPLYINTPTGESIYSEYYAEDYSVPVRLIADAWWDNVVDSAGWDDATWVDTSSCRMNCHGYAWHYVDGGVKTNIFQPELSAFWDTEGEETYVVDEAEENIPYRKILYESDHSAITTSDPGYIISKWGWGPVMRHPIDECPYYWQDEEEEIPWELTYYQIPMSGSSSVPKLSNLIVNTVDIEDATYEWTDNSYICVLDDDNDTAMLVGVNQAFGVEITVEITSTHSNTTVTGWKEYDVTSQYYYPYVDGVRPVCSTGTYEFQIKRLPPNAPIVWNWGSYINTGDQGESPADFYATGTGSSWVNATLYTGCGISPLSNYSLWAGKPVLNVSGPYEGEPYTVYEFDANPPAYSYCSDFEYKTSPANTYIHDYGDWAAITFYYEDTYQVLARATNTCGEGNYDLHWIEIWDEFRFFMSPNPASESVTISMNEPNSNEINSVKKAIESDDIPISTINIFESTTGILRYTSIKSGENFTIPLGNLNNGNYIIQINNGEKVATRQLTVEH